LFLSDRVPTALGKSRNYREVNDVDNDFARVPAPEVEGIDAETFAVIAKTAKETRPISKALGGVGARIRV
jgi:hypothetical protein